MPSGEKADPSLGIPEVRCTDCGATKKQLESWGRGPMTLCCTYSFWTVPYELIWRSLPGGEDR
jgi:hypothetical protein